MLVHKHMASTLYTMMGCEELPSLPQVQLEELVKLRRQSKADGCSAPVPLILVMRDMHMQPLLRLELQLVAMTCWAKLALWVETWPFVRGYHEGPDAR